MSWLKKYSDDNLERFSNIISLKKSDNILTHITAIFNALEIIDGVKFLGCSLDKDESKFPESINKNNEKFVPISESRYDLIHYQFEITDGEETKQIDKYLYFPKLISDTYFILNGNKYFPIYQIIDSATYNNNNVLTLKALLMGISIRETEIEYYDIQENCYKEKIKVIDLFKNKINYLKYFFAEKGYFDTLDFFLGRDVYKDNVEIYNEDFVNPNEYTDEFYIFKLTSKENLFIRKSLYDNPDISYFFSNLIEILIGQKSENIYSHDFWVIELGKIFSRNKNNYEQKAKDILISFKRILDNSTRKTLRLKDENKEDIFCIIRWMVSNFEKLILRDNMDLKYKRIRIYEYLCYDLLKKMSDSTYRLLNKTEIKLKDREQLFSNIPPMYLIKKINVADLSRYYNGVNAIEMFNPNLKFSMRGPQGLGGQAKAIPDRARGLHPSYIGKIGLTTATNGDPGMTGSLTPFVEIFDNQYFSDENID